MTTIKVISSLIIVIALMYSILKIIQKYSKFGTRINSNTVGLKIDNILYIDENAKIITLLRASTTYILAVGKHGITIIDKYEIDQQI